MTAEELAFLTKNCPYLTTQYLTFLSNFHLKPSKQLKLSFSPANDTGADDDVGDFRIDTEGLWLDTILYEIPLLALVSEAYFKFVERDWSHDGQEEKAYQKGVALLQGGCMFSEFGTRRRRLPHPRPRRAGAVPRRGGSASPGLGREVVGDEQCALRA